MTITTDWSSGASEVKVWPFESDRNAEEITRGNILAISIYELGYMLFPLYVIHLYA